MHFCSAMAMQVDQLCNCFPYQQGATLVGKMQWDARSLVMDLVVKDSPICATLNVRVVLACFNHSEYCQRYREADEHVVWDELAQLWFSSGDRLVPTQEMILEFGYQSIRSESQFVPACNVCNFVAGINNQRVKIRTIQPASLWFAWLATFWGNLEECMVAETIETQLEILYVCKYFLFMNELKPFNSVTIPCSKHSWTPIFGIVYEAEWKNQLLDHASKIPFQKLFIKIILKN